MIENDWSHNKPLETNMFAAALYDFKGSGDPNELLFSANDVMEILTLDGDWLKAKLGDKQGIVPRNYIKLLEDVKTSLPLPKSVNSSNGMSNAVSNDVSSSVSNCLLYTSPSPRD